MLPNKRVVSLYTLYDTMNILLTALIVDLRVGILLGPLMKRITMNKDIILKLVWKKKLQEYT